jgi:hypothetical protein
MGSHSIGQVPQLFASGLPFSPREKQVAWKPRQFYNGGNPRNGLASQDWAGSLLTASVTFVLMSLSWLCLPVVDEGTLVLTVFVPVRFASANST